MKDDVEQFKASDRIFVVTWDGRFFGLGTIVSGPDSQPYGHSYEVHMDQEMPEDPMTFSARCMAVQHLFEPFPDSPPHDPSCMRCPFPQEGHPTVIGPAPEPSNMPVKADEPDLARISQPYFCEAHDQAMCDECNKTALTHNVICVKINCFAPSQTRCESFGPFTQADADSIAYQLGRLIPAEWSFYSQSAENVNDAVIIKQLLFEEE